ncbi:MAG: hypothetical protein NVS9B7_02470 [Flavisolibacter sp.]
MKTRFLVLITLVFFSSAAMAQFHIGVKGGTNITKIQGQSFKDEFRYGYSLGGFAEIGFGGRLGIQPEVIFNEYQTRLDSTFSHVYRNAGNISTYKDVKLNYLTIPVLLNYKLGSFLSLQAGPQFGIKINNNKTLLDNGKDAFKNGDLSMVGGVQLHIFKFRVSGRYVVGLQNISDLQDQNKWKNKGYQLAVGLAL